MRTLYIVTHPEATHHVEGVVGGWYDFTLTDRGLQQAERIARRLRNHIPREAAVELYSSDLTRAAQTARAIANLLEVEPHFMPDLREKSYGEAEGKPQAWLDARFVPPPPTGERMTHDEGITGAETKYTFAARLYAALNHILAAPVAHQVIVTHGFALTFLVAAWIHLPLESAGYVNFRVASGSITLLEEDGFYHNRSVVLLNDTGHLAEGE